MSHRKGWPLEWFLGRQRVVRHVLSSASIVRENSMLGFMSATAIEMVKWSSNQDRFIATQCLKSTLRSNFITLDVKITRVYKQSHEHYHLPFVYTHINEDLFSDLKMLRKVFYEESQRGGFNITCPKTP